MMDEIADDACEVQPIPEVQMQLARDLFALATGYVLHRARLLRGMSREDLSTRIRRSVKTIENVEHGYHHGSLDIVSDIATGLGYEIVFDLHDIVAVPLPTFAAQAIEARSGETGTGSIGAADESAVPQGCAQQGPAS